MPKPAEPSTRITRSSVQRRVKPESPPPPPPPVATPSKRSREPAKSKSSREKKAKTEISPISARPSICTSSDPPKSVPVEMSDFEIALSNLKQIKEDKEKLNLPAVYELKRQFKLTVEKAKRETQELDQQRSMKKAAGTTRSGVKRGAPKKQPTYSDGKWVNKGIDDALDKFDSDELEYLKNMINKVKEVNELKFEHLKYLIVDVYLDELKSIKKGTIESEFHNRYMDLQGQSKMDLLSDIRTSMFTNEQVDYINGLLQGAFDTVTKDANGDIKHADINYVQIVMFAEATIRIVKHVHKLDSIEETEAFMLKRSYEDYGLDDDDD